MGLNLKLKPPILIPRFETEQMVAMLFQNKYFQERLNKKISQNKPFAFLQFGCGTGAIGLSSAKYFEDKDINYSGQMMDVQPIAIDLSLLNLKRNNMRGQNLTIYKKDMIELLQNQPSSYFQTFDLVISNPPYISVNQYNKTLQRQVKKYESKMALVGDEKINKNGLFYVDKIINKIEQCQQSKRPLLVIEFGGEDLSYLGKDIEKSVQKDYYGKRRFVFRS